jgi:hypothetical protein
MSKLLKSSLLTEKAQSLLSAALRHTRDAEHLADTSAPGSSLDRAYHLAGYGPECARKSILSIRWFDTVIGHRFSPSTEKVIEFALALDPPARRYDVQGWHGRCPAIERWTEVSRYEATDTYSKADVDALVAEARVTVDRVLFSLWVDGRVPGGFRW